jgi:hypothetical protein
MKKIGQIVGINLGIFLLYSLLSIANGGIDLLVGGYLLHVGILFFLAIFVYIRDAFSKDKLGFGHGLLLSALVILIVGFSSCTMFMKPINFH